MLLEEAGHGQVDLPSAAKEGLAAKGPLALQGPHVDLLLAIRKGAVAGVPTLLVSSDIYTQQGREGRSEAGAETTPHRLQGLHSQREPARPSPELGPL